MLPALAPKRYWPYLIVLLVVLTGLLLGVAPDATNETGIVGEVTALKGETPFSLPGIPRAKVTTDVGGYSTTTDRRGQYKLVVPPGVYQVTFSAPGFADYTQQVMVPASGKAMVSVALFPEPQGPSVAGGDRLKVQSLITPQYTLMLVILKILPGKGSAGKLGMRMGRSLMIPMLYQLSPYN